MSKYEVLGVNRSSPLQEIKGAYQAAALATHPDKQASLATDVLKSQVCLCAESCVSGGLSRSKHKNIRTRSGARTTGSKVGTIVS